MKKMEKNKFIIDPQITYPNNPTLTFAEYINLCKELIARNRLDLETMSEKIIEANSPFELRPNTENIKAGVLLVHGLLDSPFQMQDIGTYLQNQGLLVRSILLPGHGTVPGALLNVTYQQWADSVSFGFNKLAEEVDHVFLMGNSTGASLSLYHALHCDRVAGIILISPALKLSNPFASLVPLYRPISSVCSRFAWYHLVENNTLDYVKYRSIPFNAVDQVCKLYKKISVHHQVAPLQCPLFCAVSREDSSIHSESVIRYFSEQSHPANRMVLYSGKPITFPDPRITVYSSCDPKWNIVSASHIALPIHPDNPHYGKQGDCPNASHIEDKTHPVVYGEYSDLFQKYNRLLTQWGLSKTDYQRLSFNPDFNRMADQISHFIKNIAS